MLLEGPDDSFTPPKWLLESIRLTLKEGSTTPSKPEVEFDVSPRAIRFNTELLRKHDFDLESLIYEQTGSTMWHGAEFRALSQLQRTYGSHPNFPFVKEILTDGMTYYFQEELSEGERLAELRANLDRGNHKSAMSDEAALHKMLESDVTKGFALPVDRKCVEKIKGAMVQPAGMAEQHTLKADGSRVPKKRLTHDLSYSITKENASVNSRIDMNQYPEMIYGCCFHRIIHWVSALRSKHPTKRILISKYDFSDAYRRMTHSQRIIQTIPDVSPLTDICTVLNERLQVIQIDNTLTLALLRSTCDATPKLGFHPQDIGNRSIRSGAAMALFMSRTTPDRIMLLGRWKSTAFMDYIRPQVLQWSLHLAPSMIKFNHFFSTHPPATPTSSMPPTLHTLHHGRPIKIKSFNVDFENVSS